MAVLTEDKRAYYRTRKPFQPVAGKWYENQGGGIFLCLSSNPFGITMQSKNTRWTFDACGVGIYEDGKIDWDYSLHGHFQS